MRAPKPGKVGRPNTRYANQVQKIVDQRLAKMPRLTGYKSFPNGFTKMANVAAWEWRMTMPYLPLLFEGINEELPIVEFLVAYGRW